MKMIFCVLAASLFTAISSQANVKLVKSKDAKLGTVIELSNAYVKLRLFPDKGGAIKSFKYDGVEFASHDGMLNDHLWDQRLHGDFWERQYSYKVEKGNGFITVKLSRVGESGLYQFIEIHKSITIRSGSPALLIKYTYLNRNNSRSDIQVKPWFHYVVGGPGENAYLAPSTKGISKFNWVPGDKMSERWLYDCARGWTGFVNKKTKTGLVFTPEYKYLQCFYSWKNSELATLEWRLAPITIQCGKSFSTEFEVIPFKGLDIVSGAGNGIVGELTDDSVNLFSAENETVNVKVLNSAGAVLKSETKTLPPNTALSIKFPKQSAEVTCEISKNGKLSLDLKRGVSTKPLEFAWEPLEKRKLQKEKKLSWRYKISDNLNLPFIPFAKPWSGGKLKVFFLLNLSAVANVISLEKRMDIEPSYTLLPANWWGIGWLSPKMMPVGPLQIAKRVRAKALDKLPTDLDNAKPQVVLVGEFFSLKYRKAQYDWNFFPKSIQKKLLKMVENGTGLVVVGRPTKKAPWKSGLQTIYDKALPAPEITTDPALPANLANCAKIAKHGKGKIVFLNYHASGLIPHLTYEQVQDRLQEVLFTLPARAILASADKLTPKAKTANTSSIYLRNGIEYTKKPSIAGEYVELKVDRDKDGRVARWKFNNIKVKSPVYITKLKPDKEIYKKGEQISVSVKLNKPALGGKLILDVYDNHERLVQKISFPSKTAENEFQFRLDNPLTVLHSIVAILTVDGNAVSSETSAFYIPGVFSESNPFLFHLWCGTLQSIPEYYIKPMVEAAKTMGFGSICEGTAWRLGESSKFYAKENLRIAPININRVYLKDAVAIKMNRLYKDTGDTKYLTRSPCFNDQVYRDAIKEKLRKVAKIVQKYGSTVFMLGDEMSLTTEGGELPIDICFSNQCLHSFRQSLKKRYNSLANLNGAWYSSFKKWEDVVPSTLQESEKSGKWASWMDHRQQMDTVYAGYFKLASDAIREINPRGMVGESGIHDKLSVYGGYDWSKRMKAEKVALFYGTGTLPMSFADRHKFVFSSWSLGYSAKIEKNKFTLWRALLRGQNMISYFYICYTVNPDMRLSYYGKGMKEPMLEVANGIGDALVRSDKVTSPIAILASQRSLLISFIKKNQGVIDTYRLYRVNTRMWTDLIMGYGYTPYFIDQTQLSANELEKRGCKALILPMTYSLTKNDAEEIRQFVKNGGMVIADACTATYDENGNKLEKGMLDDLFNITRNKSHLKSVMTKYDFRDEVVSAGIIETGVEMKGKVLARSKAGEKDDFFGSISFENSGNDQTMTKNSYGKGIAYYLGATRLKLSSEKGCMITTLLEDAGIKPSMEITSTKGLVTSENGSFASGEIKYYGIILDKKQAILKNTIEFDSSGCIYEVRSGLKLGEGNKVVIPQKPQGAKLFAVLPRPPLLYAYIPPLTDTTLNYTIDDGVPSMPGTCQGRAIEVQLKSNIKGKYPLRITVRAPSGKVSNALSRNAFAPSIIKIPFALNDETGVWQIEIQDVITKKKLIKKIKVSKMAFVKELMPHNKLIK